MSIEESNTAGAITFWVVAIVMGIMMAGFDLPPIVPALMPFIAGVIVTVKTRTQS